MTVSLRDLLKKRIIKYIINDAQSKMEHNYTVIIGDDITIQILHHCFRMHELNELNVGLVLNVKYSRQRLKVSPIYFLSANYESAKFMCADYQYSNNTTYWKPVNVYFNSKVPQKIIELIKYQNIRKYIQTLSEIYIDFLVLEHGVFSCVNGGYKSFDNLYKKDTKHWNDELALRAQQLIGVCLTLEQEPYITYSVNSPHAKFLAQSFHQQFNDTKATLTHWTPNKQQQCILFICDRRDDPITPLMHNLSFQPMIYDLFNGNIFDDGNKIKVINNHNNGDEIRNMPDENDPIWMKYRHEFIGEVLNKLPSDFNNWKKDNNIPTDNHITPMLLPKVKQYTTNILIAEGLLQIFKNNGLRDIVELEQDMTTGINEDGKKIDSNKIQKQLIEILSSSLTDSNGSLKQRLCIIYYIMRHIISTKNKKSILQEISFNDKEIDDMMDNLCYLGIMTFKTVQKLIYGYIHDFEKNEYLLYPIPDGIYRIISSYYDIKTRISENKRYWKEVCKIAKSKVETTDIIRWISYLQWMLDNHFFDHDTSYKNLKWIQKPIKIKKIWSERGRRCHRMYIVFYLGGISYSEISTCYQFGKQNDVDIMIGSTLIYSPQQYLKCFQ